MKMVDKLVNSEINNKRIADVENCFGMSGVPLGVPGRVLVGEGVLTKICRKKPKSRQFFLFNDILVYGTILINKKKYAQQHIIPLEGLVIEDLPDETVMKNGWYIKTSSKSFAVYAGSSSEKAEWIRHIKKCANDLLEQTGRRAPSASEHAAVWIPDSIARVCMHCKRTHFTMINRRHHCRACGNVICGHCSKNRVVILHQSNSPVRVCDSCYDEFYNHLNSKKSSTCTLRHAPALITKSSVKQQLLDNAAEIKTCIEQVTGVESEDKSEISAAENTIEKIEKSVTRLSEEANETVMQEKEESSTQSELKIIDDSNLNNQTSDSEEDQNDLSSSVEDILDESHGKPTFYDMQSSKELTNDEQKEDCKNDLTNGESKNKVEKVDSEPMIASEAIEKMTLVDKSSNGETNSIKCDEDRVKQEEIIKEIASSLDMKAHELMSDSKSDKVKIEEPNIDKKKEDIKTTF